MKISESALAVLDESRIDGCSLFLPGRQLERKLYEEVNKVLVALGGAWNRKAKAHVFDHDPTDDVEAAVQTGDVVDPKKVFQFFETPAAVVGTLLSMAGVQAGMKVLEPSAGDGAIADALLVVGADVTCVELDPKRVAILEGKGHKVIHGDFLANDPDGVYDAVVMNPPFTRLQDVDHVLHAFKFLRQGGVLVSVMSASPFFRTIRKAVGFCEWLDLHEHETMENPAGAFKESGTGVKTVIVRVVKQER